jgi:hypothetical protein
MEEIRKKYSKAYEKWSEDEDAVLVEKYNSEVTIRDLSNLFQRKPGAIRARLRKLDNLK